MPGTFSLVMMDAGQGDAALIVAPDDSVILVDCGCKKNGAVVTSQIQQALAHFLKKTGNHLKGLILTHPDGDHYNLLKALVIDAGITVGYIRYGGRRQDYDGLSAWLPPAGAFTQGHYDPNIVPELSFDGKGHAHTVEVRVIAANVGDPAKKQEANLNSVVLLVTCLDVNLFLMGDATAATEDFIRTKLAMNMNLLTGKRTLLKVGHHGSRTSSSQAWLSLIRPQLAFVSSDTKAFNGTSIPSSTVMDRIKSCGSLIDFGAPFAHHYVQYNEQSYRHEQVSTTLGIFSSLHFLRFAPDNITFTAYGTTWSYAIGPDRQPTIVPWEGWPTINNPT